MHADALRNFWISKGCKSGYIFKNFFCFILYLKEKKKRSYHVCHTKNSSKLKKMQNIPQECS